MEIFGLSVLELFPVLLFFISIFGLVTADNAIKSIVYMIVLNGAVITFWIAMGSRAGRTPPIFVDDIINQSGYFYAMADPVPQALMITTIIIGFCVTAINIIMLNTVFKKYKTTNWKILFDLARERVMRDKDATLSDIVYEEQKEAEI